MNAGQGDGIPQTKPHLGDRVNDPEAPPRRVTPPLSQPGRSDQSQLPEHPPARSRSPRTSKGTPATQELQLMLGVHDEPPKELPTDIGNPHFKDEHPAIRLVAAIPRREARRSRQHAPLHTTSRSPRRVFGNSGQRSARALAPLSQRRMHAFPRQPTLPRPLSSPPRER